MKTTDFVSRVGDGFGKGFGLDLEWSGSGIGVGFWRGFRGEGMEIGFVPGFGTADKSEMVKNVEGGKVSDFANCWFRYSRSPMPSIVHPRGMPYLAWVHL